MNSLRAAMRERCRSIDMSWLDAVKLLTGDARFESSALREGEKAEIFLEHQDVRAHTLLGSKVDIDTLLT